MCGFTPFRAAPVQRGSSSTTQTGAPWREGGYGWKGSSDSRMSLSEILSKLISSLPPLRLITNMLAEGSNAVNAVPFSLERSRE